MLSFTDATELLGRYGKNEAWTRHCLAVARVAAKLSCTLRSIVDGRLLVVGALLHDIGRYRTQDPILHGVEGYRLLSSLGHPREAFICASHVLCGMPAQEAVQYGLPDRDFLPLTLEERLIPLIDGVVEFDQPTTFDQRCRSISRRYQGNPAFLKRFETAAETARCQLRKLQDEYGISLEQVAKQTLCGDAAPARS